MAYNTRIYATPLKNIIMKPSDFRIGNIITDENGFEMHVVGIGEDWLTADFDGNQGDVWEFDFKNSFPKPIEITEEILLKYGFVNNLDIYFNEKTQGYFKKPFKESKEFLFKNYGGDSVCRLKYLHELQNLYWCLCNQDLKLK